MNHGCPLRIPVHSRGGQHRGHTGSDILTEKHIDCFPQRNRPCLRERLQYAYRRGGRLDPCRKYRSGKDSGRRIRRLCHHPQKKRRIPQRQHRRTHHLHTEKQNPKTHQNIPRTAHPSPVKKHRKHHSRKRHSRSQDIRMKRNQLPRNRRPDICSHNHPGGLPGRHHTGVRKTRHHHRRRRGGLDNRRHNGSGQNSRKRACSKMFQKLSHFSRSHGLKTTAKQFHAVKKQRETACQCQKFSPSHLTSPPAY